MNFVLIITDTFRRDHLGCYGNPGIHTPHLDGLAARSTVFDRCYAASFPTVPHRSDVATGKYNFTYLGWAPLPSDEITLAGVMSQAGYPTMGVVDTPFYVRRGYGYDRGFWDFMWIRGQRMGPERESVTRDWRYEEDHFAPTSLRAAERWVEQHYRERFFLLVDTWDPHEPWQAPEHYVRRYLEDYDGQPSPFPCYWFWEEAGLSEGDVKRAHAHYCAEVTMVDRAVGRFLERLESLGLMENTVVIFTADHGLCFGEHGWFGKALRRTDEGFMVGVNPEHRVQEQRFLFKSPTTGAVEAGLGKWYRSPIYEEIARIPLLIYVPGIAPRRVDALVSPPDLMPTVIELAGLEVPGTVQGRSLLPLLQGQEQAVHEFVVTSFPLYDPGKPVRIVDDQERTVAEPLPSTITDGEWSLIYATEDQPVELYHLPSDPAQQTNVFEGNEPIARELHTRFVRFLEEVGTDERTLASRRRLQGAG